MVVLCTIVELHNILYGCCQQWKRLYAFTQTVQKFCPILTKYGASWQIFVKSLPKPNFTKILPEGCCSDEWGRHTNRRTDSPTDVVLTWRTKRCFCYFRKRVWKWSKYYHFLWNSYTIRTLLTHLYFKRQDIQCSEYSSRPMLMISFSNLSARNLSYC